MRRSSNYIATACVCFILIIFVHHLKKKTKIDCLRHAGISSQPGYYLFKPPLPLSRIPHACAQVLLPRNLNNIPNIRQSASCFLNGKFSQQDRNVIRRHLRRINHVFRQADVILVLDSGSLLGAWRHHGIIPYDDNIDFRIRKDQKPDARHLFNRLCTRHGDCKFEDTETINQHWKLHIGCRRFTEEELKNATTVTTPICLVQIDIYFFWIENERIKMKEPPFTIDQEIYFPLIPRPFEGILFDTVYDIPGYIQKKYRTSVDKSCKSITYEKKPRVGCTQEGVQCSILEPFLPFVRRFLLSNGDTAEFLIKNNTIAGIFIDASRNKK